MSMDRILALIGSFDGVLDLAPTEGSTFPEIAWGDHFFYYAPDAHVPPGAQPYATIVTKDYPDDRSSDLDGPDRWRLNIHVGADAFVDLTGEHPRARTTSWDHTATDVVLPHPVYRAQGWVSVVNPADGTYALVTRLLRQAHARARSRAARRRPPGVPRTGVAEG